MGGQVTSPPPHPPHAGPERGCPHAAVFWPPPAPPSFFPLPFALSPAGSASGCPGCARPFLHPSKAGPGPSPHAGGQRQSPAGPPPSNFCTHSSLGSLPKCTSAPGAPCRRPAAFSLLLRMKPPVPTPCSSSQPHFFLSPPLQPGKPGSLLCPGHEETSANAVPSTGR